MPIFYILYSFKLYYKMYRTWAVVSFLTLHLPSHLVHLPKVDWISNPWSFVLCSVWLCKSCAAVDKSNDFVQFAKKTDDVCYHRNWIISHACHVSCSLLYVMFCVMLHVLCHVSCFMSCCMLFHVTCLCYCLHVIPTYERKCNPYLE